MPLLSAEFPYVDLPVHAWSKRCQACQRKYFYASADGILVLGIDAGNNNLIALQFEHKRATGIDTNGLMGGPGWRDLVLGGQRGSCTVYFRTKEMTMTALARLDLRLSPADKTCIHRAADLRGVPVSAFVRDAVLREAENVMATELVVTLSPAESRRFLAALDAPFKPNVRLKKAMADAAKLIG